MCAIILPVAALLNCGRRHGVLAADELVDVSGATDHNCIEL